MGKRCCTASQKGNLPQHLRRLTLTLPHPKSRPHSRIVHSRSQDGEERCGLRSPESCDNILTTGIAKSRTVAVRLMSMALTGFFMTFRRPRTHRPLSMLKYDPVGKLFSFSVHVSLCERS